MNIKFSLSYLGKFALITVSTLLINLNNQVKAAEWSEIEKRGYLIIAVKDNLPPLAFPNPEGSLQGLEIDLAHRLAQELFGTSNAVKFVPVLNQDRLQVVIDDLVDLTIAHVTANSSRYRVVDFSPFYYLDGTGILFPKNRPLSSTQADSWGRIAVLEGSSAIAVLQYNLPQIQLIGVRSYQEGLDLLQQQQINGLAGDITTLVGLSQNNSDYQLLNSIYGGYPLAIVMPKGLQYQELRDKVNQIMVKLRQQGWLQERAKYWGLPTFD
jgi:polar amino acid transport system substrate-binding protein